MVSGGSGGGTNTNLLFRLIIQSQGMQKFRQMRKQILGVSKAQNQASKSQQRLRTNTDKMNDAGSESNRVFGRMFGVGMNLMFMGMALRQVFGRLTGSMMKMTGVSQAFGAAAKSVMLPFFIDLAPLLNKIAFLFMKLPKPVKWAMGAFAAFITVLGTFMFFGAQVALLSISLQMSLLSVASAIFTVAGALFALFFILGSVVYIFKRFGTIAGIAASIVGGALLVSFLEMIGATNLLSLAIAKATGSTTALTVSMFGLQFSMTSVLLIAGSLAFALLLLQRIFKKFGVVAGALATILISSLLAAISPIAAVFVAIIGAIMTVNKAFKKFGNVIGTIATLVVAGIALLLTPIIGLPAAVAIALAAVIAWFWNMKEEIWNVIKGIGKFITQDIPRFLRKLPGILKKFFVNAIQDKIDAVKRIFNGLKTFFTGIGKILGGNFTEGLSMVIKGAKDMIIGALNTILPLGLTVGKLANMIGGGINAATDLLTPNDFILTSDGKMIRPAADDTLIGTKNPENLGGGGGDNVTVNINDPVMKDDVDVQRLVDEVEERVNRDTRGRTGGLGN